MKRLLIFDVDGTLFKTETVDVFAFNEALKAVGYAEKTQAEIMSFVGLPFDEICREMLRTDDDTLISKFKSEVIKNETKAIYESGEFYDGAIEMLKNLKAQNFTLCICSNGNEEYITDISNAFGLYEIFDHIWYEKKGFSKSDAVKILLEKYNASEFIMVGDRMVDFVAASDNDGISIGVSYGFGEDEVFSADHVVDSISELHELILKLSK